MESTLSFYSTRSGLQSKFFTSDQNLVLHDIDESNQFFRSLVNDESKLFNGFRYSEDGAMIAIMIVNKLVIGRLDQNGHIDLHCKFEDIGNIQDCYFSPGNKYLVTWQNITPKVKVNLNLWDLDNSELVKSWTVKNRSCWPIISWTPDLHKAIMIPHRGTLEIYENNIWTDKATSFNLNGMTQFSLGPGKDPKVLVFVAEGNSNNGYLSLYRNDMNEQICRRSVSKSDSISIQWSSDGSAVLVMTYMDIDSTGKLYSGRSGGLYLLRDDGFSCQVQFHKDNPPLHDFRWIPNKLEFACIYGFIPNTDTSLFNANTDKIATLVTQQPRNTLIWSPCGRLLAVGGFGNLQGYLDFFDVTNTSSHKLIGTTNQFSTTFHMFSPDSRFFVTGTLSPRLRVDNGIKILSYNGVQLFTQNFDDLYDVRYRPNPNQTLANFVIEVNTNKVETKTQTTAYVPPRRKSSAGSGNESTTPIGGGRGRGKGKSGPVGYSPVGQKKNNNNNNKNKNTGKKNDNGKDNKKNENNNNNRNPGGGKPENRKRNLLNKLKDIEKLKQRKENGEDLDQKQLEKIDNEEKIKAEITELDKILGTGHTEQKEQTN
jgi:translation initiation factor 2A